MNTLLSRNTDSEGANTRADRPLQFAIGDTIRWTEEDGRGRRTYRQGIVTSAEREHPAMKAFYEVEGCDYRIREDCARTPL